MHKGNSFQGYHTWKLYQQRKSIRNEDLTEKTKEGTKNHIKRREQNTLQSHWYQTLESTMIITKWKSITLVRTNSRNHA